MPKPVWGERWTSSTAGIEVCRDGRFRRDRGAFRIEIGNRGLEFHHRSDTKTSISSRAHFSYLIRGGKPVRRR